jgi:tRNA(Ile)-lysidine synthase
MPGIGLSKQNIAKAEKFLLTAKSGSTQHLKSGLHLAVDYDTLKITCQSDSPPTQVDLMTHVLTVRKPFENDNFLVKIIAANKKADNSVELLDQKLYVRYRQPGDKLYPAGMKGSKKLQDVFVDKKIPRNKRATWPVVVNGKNEVVWLAGVAVDRRAMVDPKKHRTINLTCEVKDQ